MANNKKPYTRNNKTFDNKDKKRHNKKNKSNVNNSINDNSPQIRMDKERINDIETLDTSFLEGRISNKKSRAVKEKLLNNKENKFLKYMKYFFIFLAVVLVIVGIYLFVRGIRKQLDKIDSKAEQKEVDVVPTPTMKIDMDNNYLFIGTFNTERLNFEDDYHYIKISDDKFETDNILEDMVGQVYQYNPTSVYILIGTNDFRDEDDDKLVNEVEENIVKIVENIQKYRSKAKIYIQSIYPVNRTIKNNSANHRQNDEIKEVNNYLKEYCEKEHLTYIDMYNRLIDEDGNLSKEYTNDGLHPNELGYSRITRELIPFIYEIEE